MWKLCNFLAYSLKINISPQKAETILDFPAFRCILLNQNTQWGTYKLFVALFVHKIFLPPPEERKYNDSYRYVIFKSIVFDRNGVWETAFFVNLFFISQIQSHYIEATSHEKNLWIPKKKLERNYASFFCKIWLH